MKRAAWLVITFWVVNWTGERYQERPCTDQETTEQKLVVCEDRLDVPFQKKFEQQEDADAFVADCTDCKDIALEQVSE